MKLLERNGAKMKIIYSKHMEKQITTCFYFLHNYRVDSAEACKKTVQAPRFGMLSELTRKGEDFYQLMICPNGAARNGLSGNT
jgi:hypothetical protein